jgi:hypothetical protein
MSDKVTLGLDSVKKNSVRYNAENDDAAIRSIYVMKNAEVLKGDLPSRITVEITANG